MENKKVVKSKKVDAVLKVAPQQSEPTPLSLIQMAMQSDNCDLDKLERLIKMQNDWEKKESEKLYTKAISEFQYKLPLVIKNKKSNTSMYADLGNIIETIREPMYGEGLSYSFGTPKLGEQITVSCTISHIGGFSKTETLEAPPDKSGNKSDIHAMGSTISYLQRYLLKGMLGIGAADADNDADDVGKVEFTDAIKKEINDCETKSKLTAIYNKYPSLKEESKFKNCVALKNQALTKKESENKESGEIPADVIKDIESCTAESQVNQMFYKYPDYNKLPGFKKLLENKKLNLKNK